MTNWAMYDTTTGDVLDRGAESWIRKRQRDEIDAADVRRAQKAISRRMSANPPRDLSRPGYH